MDFARLCQYVYCILKLHSNLLPTLLAMMILSDLAKLACTGYLKYVRKMLAEDVRDDADAPNYLIAKFNVAYIDAWTTKMGFASFGLNLTIFVK
ncbi:Phosphatidylinositol 45-bisphosphate 3-kinase catalytic subunit alpha isoform [Taenia solium]|eukprot:TsM_001027000 transcript=TsM_001027000 gene=TsM_001027000